MGVSPEYSLYLGNCAGLLSAAQLKYRQPQSGKGGQVLGRTRHSRSTTKALTAVMRVGPGTPMLFQGQEFAASSPFFCVADFEGELARPVCRGCAGSLRQFPSIAQPEMQAHLPVPDALKTFARSRLDFSERQRHAEISFHRDLLCLRREDPVLRAQRAGGMDGTVLGLEAFVLRFFGEDGDDRLLVGKRGRDLAVDPAPEPLLAPPHDRARTNLWSSEGPHYGGGGTAPLDGTENWHMPGHEAVVLRPEPCPC
jgi:maltooligosyltrehalose trehalohydrolase